jgi:signal transduction histidine kinase
MISESTTDSVIIVDGNYRITFVKGPTMVHVGERDPTGMDLRDVFLDIKDTELFHQLQEVRSRRLPASFEAMCLRRGVRLALNVFPFNEGFAIFYRDITDHKQAIEAHFPKEEQLRQRQKIELVGQLAAGVTHDLNNLLTVVSMNLDLIEEAARSDSVERFSAVARRAVDLGAKLTAHLLSFCRRQKINPTLVNANQLISEFQGLLRHAVGRRCDIRLRTDQQLWRCHVDPSLLEAALLNLVLNARDAMPGGGTLELETRNVILHEQNADGRVARPYIRLSVTDTGSGIPADILERIFEPFFTTKDADKGTGLGLSMVSGFVREAGGRVDIKSALGVGTTVALYLPKALQAPDADISIVIHPQTIHDTGLNFPAQPMLSAKNASTT